MARDATRTRARLLRAGERRFARDGVAGARLADIVRDAGRGTTRRRLPLRVSQGLLRGDRRAAHGGDGGSAGRCRRRRRPARPIVGCDRRADRGAAAHRGRAGLPADHRAGLGLVGRRQRAVPTRCLHGTAIGDQLGRSPGCAAEERVPGALARERVALLVTFLTGALAERARARGAGAGSGSATSGTSPIWSMCSPERSLPEILDRWIGGSCCRRHRSAGRGTASSPSSCALLASPSRPASRHPRTRRPGAARPGWSRSPSTTDRRRGDHRTPGADAAPARVPGHVLHGRQPGADRAGHGPARSRAPGSRSATTPGPTRDLTRLAPTGDPSGAASHRAASCAGHGIRPSRLMRPPYGDGRPAGQPRRRPPRPRAGAVDRGLARTGRRLGAADRREDPGPAPPAPTPPGRPGNIVLQHDGVRNSPASVACRAARGPRPRRRGYCFARLDRHGAGRAGADRWR